MQLRVQHLPLPAGLRDESSAGSASGLLPHMLLSLPQGPWPPLAEPPPGPGALLEPNISTIAASWAEKREISQFWAEKRNTSNCLVCPACGSLSSQMQDFLVPYLKGARHSLSGCHIVSQRQATLTRR